RISTALLPSDFRLSFIAINSPPPSLVASQFARVVVSGGGSPFFDAGSLGSKEPFIPTVFCHRGLWYVNLSVLAVGSFAVSYLN
ncbi:hypothetical protein L195_g055192, partial [Trifolium pratense]